MFGFKAKKMRQEKLSGLIHQSAAYPHLDYCRVEIHFREIVDLVRVDMRCCMDRRMLIKIL